LTKPTKKAAPKKAAKAEAPTPLNFRTLDRGGLFAGVPAQLYHEDPLPTPSLSNHFLATLHEKSPRHAWIGHPRLNPAWRRRPSTDGQDFGSAAHAAVLGAGRVKIIEAKNYLSDFAKTARKQAYLNGEVPVLKPRWELIQEMRRVLLAKLSSLESTIPNVFDERWQGRPEVMAAWQEDGLWCRALADYWIKPQPEFRFAPDGLIVDYKTTAESAMGEDWPRTLYGMNGDYQPVWYRHGFNMAMRQGDPDTPRPNLPRFIYIVQENVEPFASEFFELSAVADEHARGKMVDAFWRAAACFKLGEWPDYPARLNKIEPPQWLLQREEFRRVASTVMQRGI
jgi:hypothetical protein